MKRSILIFLITAVYLPVLAQRGQAPYTRNPGTNEKIRAAHAAYVTERLELTPEEAERFWPVYREYAEKRRGLRHQLRENQRNEANEEKLLERDLKIQQDELDLEKEYLQKFQKIIPAEKLIKLRQAEADFRKLIFRQIQLRHRQRRN